MWRTRVKDDNNRTEAKRPLRARRPELEPCEGRTLLSAGAIAHPAASTHAAVAAPTAIPLARYRVFEATITRGPHAGFTLKGPLVLVQTDRIQVFGYVFPETGGRRITVVGTVYGGAASLRFILPQGGAFEVVGSGRLRRVANGLPGGESLVGLGNVSGPSKNDHGTWLTLAPSKAQGA
jgi:hypothetical protein